MTFNLPREIEALRTFNETKFNDIMPILFNEVNLDVAFTLFFERAIRKGHVSRKLSTKDFEHGKYSFYQNLVPQLSKHSGLKNFDSDEGRAILSSWLKASIVEFVPLRRDRSILIPNLLKLLTVATYRSRLPRSNNKSAARQIDSTVYGVLVSYLRNLKALKPEAEIQMALINTSISKGIDFHENDYPWKGPRYNGKDELDISTMLELRLLELFEETESKMTSEEMVLPLAKPLHSLAVDFMDITRVFGNRSSDDLLSMYKSVFSLRLYQLPIHLAIVLNSLKKRKPLAIDYSHKMFVDFSGQKGTLSYQHANENALNDLQTTSSLINLTIYFLNAKKFKKVKTRGNSNDAQSKYLTIQDLEELGEFALSDIASITSQTFLDMLSEHFEENEDKISLSFMNETMLRVDNSFEALVELISADVGKRSRDGYRKWFKNVGGVDLPRATDTVALLSGNEKTRTWTYSMTDRMLETLIDLCFVDASGRAIRRALDLEDIIFMLKERFGVLVNESAHNLGAIESGQAANFNFQEFKKRLRQLGRFESLSDEFEAQYVKSPFRTHE